MLTGDEEGMVINMKKGGAALLRFDDGAQAGGAIGAEGHLHLGKGDGHECDERVDDLEGASAHGG
jgi:hypothetical protein